MQVPWRLRPCVARKALKKTRCLPRGLAGRGLLYIVPDVKCSSIEGVSGTSTDIDAGIIIAAFPETWQGRKSHLINI